MAYVKQDLDLHKETFATIGGVKGTQFGRDVYSAVLKFKDLEDFLEVFPNVQRQLNKSRIYSIKKYILSGVENKKSLRFFSSITATCKGTIFFDEGKQRIAIDINSKMSLNDGQHRFEAVKLAIKELQNLVLNNARDLDTRKYYENLVKELQEMIIPVIIFDGLSEKEEKQLFHDLNNLQQRPSKSANIKLSQTDPYAVLSRDLAESNRYLRHYGVEMDKTSIGKNNKNTFLLATLYNSIKILVNELTEENYEENKDYVLDTFDKLFYVLPHDINESGKYIVRKSYTLLGIIEFINEARSNMLITEEEIFDTIKNGDFSNNMDVYSKYGAVVGTNGNVIFGSSTLGKKAITQYLFDILESRSKKTKNKEEVKA